MCNSRCFLLVLVAASLMANGITAAPTEIGDYGKVERSMIHPMKVQQTQLRTPMSSAKAQRSIAKSHYPVITRSMSASGRHSTVRRVHAGTGNLFLIGNDFYSTTWLRKNHAQLKALGAQGIVVNVPNAQSFAQLKQMANGLPLVAASVDDLAQQLKLKHYPVLITESER